MKVPTGTHGFTLIELLIAVCLMVILTTIIATIFHQAVEAFMNCDAQVQIYSNARHNFDFMAREVFGILPLESWAGPSEQRPILALTNGGSDETTGALDSMRFKTLAPTASGVQPATVWYFPNDTNRTVLDERTNQRIRVYTLRRRLCELTDDDRDLAGEEQGGSDICQYVRAINIDRIPYGGRTYFGILSGTDGYLSGNTRLYYASPGSIPVDKRLPRGIRVTIWLFDQHKRQDRVLTKYFMINSR